MTETGPPTTTQTPDPAATDPAATDPGATDPATSAPTTTPADAPTCVPPVGYELDPLSGELVPVAPTTP